MSQYFRVHPENPQPHLMRQSAAILKKGGVIVYPTDSAYAIGCQIGDKAALTRIKRIRQLNDKHLFTLMCRDLSELATYSRVDNHTFRLLKAFTPGPYTFVLQATREVPRRLLHPKRKTIGYRIPDHVVTQALLEAFEAPLMSTTLVMPGGDLPLIEPEAIADILGKQVDLIIDSGSGGIEETTVVDLVEGIPKIIRYGKGDVAGLE